MFGAPRAEKILSSVRTALPRPAAAHAELRFIDDREFQLVTLATDRTVKLEYIFPAVLEVKFAPSEYPQWFSRRNLGRRQDG